MSCGGDEPALEILIGSLGCILHVDGICRLIACVNHVDRDGTKNDAFLRLVRHIVHGVDHGVEGHGFAICNAGIKLGLNGFTNLFDRHAVIDIFNGVVLFGGPPAEHLSGRKLTGAGIVENRFELALVALFDLHGGNGIRSAHEVDRQARIRTALDDDVDGELVGVEALPVGGSGGGVDVLGDHLVGHVVDAHVIGLSARVAEGHPDSGAVGGLDLVAVGIVERDVERDDDLRVGLLLGNRVLDLGELVACDGLCREVPALGQNAVVHADRDGHAVDGKALGAGEHGGRRSGLFLRFSLSLRLLLGNGLFLDRGLLFGDSLVFDGRFLLGDSILFENSLLFGDSLVFNDGFLLDHDLRLSGILVIDEINLRLGSRILDDDCIHVVGRERICRLLEGICHPLRGEHLPHEDEREDPCKRTTRALAEPAELLTHDQHLSFGPREDGKSIQLSHGRI